MGTSADFNSSPAPLTATILATILIILFGLYSAWYSSRKHIQLEAKTLENFLTARNQIGWTNIGWSLYASAVGSWVITAPAQFGFFGGIIGAFAYAFAAAVPLIMIGYLGGTMRDIYPSILSLSDFVLWRFGRKTQILVVLVSLLNMSIAATAEYTTLSSLYSNFVGLKDFTPMIVVLVAVVTLSYTTYGGLKASIITDRAQAVVSLFLVQVMIIYLVADFSKEKVAEHLAARDGVDVEDILNSSFQITSDLKGTNASGYGSLFTLPFSLFTATIFSEAIWQRSWAAMDRRTLHRGSWMGAILVFLVVGFFGSLGVLVQWAGLITFDQVETLDANLYAFQVFTDEAGKVVVSSAIGVLVLLLGTTMSEGAIDSLQNGVGASISGALGRLFETELDKIREEKETAVENDIVIDDTVDIREADDANEEVTTSAARQLRLGRIVLVVVNIPYIIIGLQQFSILSLFLFGNMICVCAFFPIIIGLFPSSPFHPYFRDFMPPLSFILCLLGTMIFAGVYYDKDDFGAGVSYAFWGNTLYEYPYFLASFLISVFVTLAIIGATAICSRKEVGSDEQEVFEQPKDAIERNDNDKVFSPAPGEEDTEAKEKPSI